jgi:hypothetical protein
MNLVIARLLATTRAYFASSLAPAKRFANYAAVPAAKTSRRKASWKIAASA